MSYREIKAEERTAGQRRCGILIAFDHHLRLLAEIPVPLAEFKSGVGPAVGGGEYCRGGQCRAETEQ